MNQRKNTGMRIRQAPNPRKTELSWLLQMIVAMMASAVLVLTAMALAGIHTGFVLAVMLGVAMMLCLIYGILRKTGGAGWFYIGVLVVLLALTLACRQWILEGFRIFWNLAGEAMLRGTGWVLPEWELQLDAGQQELSMMLFAGLTACAMTLMCCALTSIAPAALAVLLPALLFGGMSLFGVDDRFLWVLPVLGVSILIWTYSSWRNSIKPVVLSWGVCIAAACMLVAAVAMPGIQNWAQAVGAEVRKSIHESKYETRYTSLPEGDFSDYEAVSRKAESALSVTMDQPQQLYLRGFTGAVFTGESWEGLDAETLVKNQQLLYWLNRNAFDQNAQFDAAAAYAQVQQSTVTVQNIGACSYYQYVPFSIAEGAWAQAENLNTDGVHADAERSYVYSVTAADAQTILQVLTHLQTASDPAVLQYRKAESGYRQFIYHYYLQIPETVREMLEEEWDVIAARYGSANNLTQQQAQSCALIFLSKCFSEGGTPEDLELPLALAGGTSYQYATVAAMTLRYFGIPARYAEGYVISEEMAAKFNGGETMTVDSSCAKAWVEVYQDGIGWIPMDLTPGMGELLDNPDSSDSNQENGSSDAEEAEKEEEDEPEDEPEEQPEPNGGTMVTIILKAVRNGILILLLVLLAIFLILCIRRKILMHRKNMKFQCASCNDAVAWIYADTALILEKLGLSRGNGSMRSLRAQLEEKYGADFASQFDDASDLNDRAMFSSRGLCEDDREHMMQFRSHTLLKLKTEVKWYRRFWLRWGLCLY